MLVINNYSYSYSSSPPSQSPTSCSSSSSSLNWSLSLSLAASCSLIWSCCLHRDVHLYFYSYLHLLQLDRLLHHYIFMIAADSCLHIIIVSICISTASPPRSDRNRARIATVPGVSLSHHAIRRE